MGSPRSLAVAQEGRSPPGGRKRGADLLARGDSSPSNSLVKRGRRGGDSRRSPATEEEEEEEEQQEMEADGREEESQEESPTRMQQQQQRSNAKVRQPSVRVERQSLSARQRQQLAKESVQPQLNLQDEFASPEKALEEEQQRR